MTLVKFTYFHIYAWEAWDIHGFYPGSHITKSFHFNYFWQKSKLPGVCEKQVCKTGPVGRVWENTPAQTSIYRKYGGRMNVYFSFVVPIRADK